MNDERFNNRLVHGKLYMYKNMDLKGVYAVFYILNVYREGYKNDKRDIREGYTESEWHKRV